MDKIGIKNVFAAVFEKSVLDPLLDWLKARPSQGTNAGQRPGLNGDGDYAGVKFWGTEGTINYVKSKGFGGEAVVRGFDFDGRVKSLDRANFVRILADKLSQSHVDELDHEGLEPFDLVSVDLYAPDPKIFPESMDIGGQSLIRAAVKNYKNIALAFDKKSIRELVLELKENNGSTTEIFRKSLARKAAKFIAQRTKLEAEMFEKIT